MRLRTLLDQNSGPVPTGLLVSARLANMLMGLATIPLLIHYLGGDGFAAWAVLLALAAVFSLLEFGMAPTFIKEAAPALELGDLRTAGTAFFHAGTIVAVAFLLGSIPLFLGADAIARVFRLPDGQWLTGGDMVRFLFVAVAARALMQFVSHSLNAGRRFPALAACIFLQSLASNVAAVAVAVTTGKLDLALLSFMLSQLLVLAVAAFLAPSIFRPSAWNALAYPHLRSLWWHGLKVQVYDWTQIVCYQYDKFLIAAFVGLWAVAPYEVGNRSVQALRSVPASGLNSFLASAAIGQKSRSALWLDYQRMTEIAMITVLVFMLAPLAIAPAFLYAWTGQMGYAARAVFLSLVVGAAFSVLAMPAGALAQAAGRADLQARSALLTLAINIPLSWLLVLKWQMSGVAIGTAVAMMVGSLSLVVSVHALYGRPLGATGRILAKFWPSMLVCLVWGLASYGIFEAWISTTDEATRYSRGNRVIPGLLAVAVYGCCLASMVLVQARRSSLTPEFLDAVARVVPRSIARLLRLGEPGEKRA